MKILRAVIYKLDVIVKTDSGNFTVHPQSTIDGPNIFPSAPRHQIAPTFYYGGWQGNWKAGVPGNRQELDVPAEWCAHLDAISKAATATGNFNR
jgi:hypothetical protein